MLSVNVTDKFKQKNETTYLFWPVITKIYKRISDHTKFYYILND